MVKGIDTPDSYYKLQYDRQDTGNRFRPIFIGTVIDAMGEIVDGTARVARVQDIQIAGKKPGTVENKNSFDHSAFMAFAPKEKSLPNCHFGLCREIAGWGAWEWQQP